MKKTIRLLFFVIISNLIGFIGRGIGGGFDFDILILPPYFIDTNYIMVSWAAIYSIIGIAAFFANNSGHHAKQTAINIFYIQLLINALWPFLFFRLELYYIAFLWGLLLYLAVIFNSVVFFKVHKLAGCLFVPYIVWLTYLGYINYYISLHNISLLNM